VWATRLRSTGLFRPWKLTEHYDVVFVKAIREPTVGPVGGNLRLATEIGGESMYGDLPFTGSFLTLPLFVVGVILSFAGWALGRDRNKATAKG